ncbi:CocE/NonD family hydrolase [Frankia sp. AgB1.9]|uniref:CocE/NonD family hydrolase n=1 Tax=unclassified Frankia TaxID=2632575 RepID=UPI001932182D|nr:MULTISPECIES: CocE/NonD family hydrolase [unclassified Frankia]MBL7493700.1 CocE/NonD family hydrolase [Frankia sp. AgW1.1]MBL7553015.1 CocE/NonD family hydrolase [Frankia sp. AgB1.9]MBL7621593.1 CocE/NonD family hydrolase [Frankia sp. AgB1.8]
MTRLAGPWANLRVAGHDGTLLATDAHLPPPADWPVPVVVTRTPYGRSAHLVEGQGWAARGFGYVVQDVRGRYDSDGTWRPYRDERADGAALADWIVAQPWCDGRLVAYGGSYSGYTAWALAVARPGAVRAVVSLGPSMGLHRTRFEPSGILRLAEHAYWWLERADARTSRDGLGRLLHARQPDLLDHRPVSELPERLGVVLPHWGDILRTGPEPGPEALTCDELARVRAAAFHLGGWYDLLVPETLEHWDLVGSAVTPRPPRRLVVGAWGHDLAFGSTTRVGDRDHGARSRYEFGMACVDWLRAVLAGPGSPARTPGSAAMSTASATRTTRAISGVEVFVRGADRWIRGAAWPPGDAAEDVWHARADGTLSTAGPGPGGVRAFRYDPDDPFPSAVPGADRRALLGRPDAVRYLTRPLAEPVTLLGPGRVELAVTTDAAEADWIVRVLAWLPAGPVYEIGCGSATWPAGPDGAATGTVALSGAAERVPAGARIILEITSSDHPTLARNPGTGQDRYTTTLSRACEQAVRSGAGHVGTRLTLLTAQANAGSGAGCTAEAGADTAALPEVRAVVPAAPAGGRATS